MAAGEGGYEAEDVFWWEGKTRRYNPCCVNCFLEMSQAKVSVGEGYVRKIRLVRPGKRIKTRLSKVLSSVSKDHKLVNTTHSIIMALKG